LQLDEATETAARSRPLPPARGEPRWKPEGDLPTLLSVKLSECLWWILVLAERLDVDIAEG
jgi:hypothetical protein